MFESFEPRKTEKAKCPKKKNNKNNKNSTLPKTMPQAAGKNCLFNYFKVIDITKIKQHRLVINFPGFI